MCSAWQGRKRLVPIRLLSHIMVENGKPLWSHEVGWSLVKPAKNRGQEEIKVRDLSGGMGEN